MCSKIGAAQVAAASTCTGLSEPRWLPAEDVSGENLTVWEAGVRQRGSTSEITNVPRSRVRQSGSRRSLPLCRPSATQSRLPGKMLLSQKINTRSDAGPHRKSDCERATQLSACGVAGWRLHAAHVREGNSAHAGWRAAVLRSGVPFVRVSSWHARVHVTCIHVHMPHLLRRRCLCIPPGCLSETLLSFKNLNPQHASRWQACALRLPHDGPRHRIADWPRGGDFRRRVVPRPSRRCERCPLRLRARLLPAAAN